MIKHGSVPHYKHVILDNYDLLCLAIKVCFSSCCCVGFEQFTLWRSDRTLVFHSLVGEHPPTPKKSKKGKQSHTPGKSKFELDDDDYDDDDDEEEDMELAVDDDDSGAESSQSSLLSTPKANTRRLALFFLKCD